MSLNLDKQARQINYTTMNALGVVLQQETHTNVTSDKYTIATSELPSGTYFVVIDIDGRSIVRKFSVIK